jgi:CRISPR system Cascade subunit CasA
MNLATEPWVPILKLDSSPDLVSLQQIFTEGDQYSDLAVRPHERIALMRLLICIAQAALDGPKNIDEWDEAPKKLSEAASTYLKDKQDAFELFHTQKPFLQIAKLKKVSDKTTLASKMEFNLSSQTGQELFDHGLRTNKIYHSNELPLLLITYLNFSTGGGLPIAKWDEMKTAQVGNKDAPCIASSMYHTFLRGRSVTETLCLNILTKQTVKNRLGINWGTPVWQMMPDSPNDQQSISNANNTYLGRLVPLSRWIKLYNKSNQMLCCNGFDYVSQTIREPSATLIVRNDKRLLLGAITGKSVWRDLPALIVKNASNDSLGCAITLQNIPDNKPFDIYVGALIRKSGQQDIIDMIESVVHIPAAMNTDLGIATYEAEVLYSEKLGRKLYNAVNWYFKNLSDDWAIKLKNINPQKRKALKNKLTNRATNHFWTSIEKLRHLLMSHVDTIGQDSKAVEDSRIQWRKAVFKAALDAYHITCGQETPRQMRAFALGWEKFFITYTDGNASDDSESETSEE